VTENLRFGGLKKLSAHPAAELLAQSGLELQTEISSPPGASVAEVLAELESKGEMALPDMFLLLALALPMREAVWWSCLAMRDLLGEGGKPWPTLKAAEDWVFKPGDATRKGALEAAEKAGDEPSELCATAVTFCDGKLGPYEMQAYDAPPWASAKSVFGAIMVAFAEIADRESEAADAAEEAAEEAAEAEAEAAAEAAEAAGEEPEEIVAVEPPNVVRIVGNRLLERGLDIARGGNGKREPAA